MCHALCHTVEPASSSEAPYNASSPDELALVCAARALGLEFLRLAENQMQLGVSKVFTDLLGPFGYNGSGPFQAELLDVCEFDNVRKRMSVLLRMPSGEILLYVKGRRPKSSVTVIFSHSLDKVFALCAWQSVS